jgi:uncharacterized protein GlcG (DUF336 family)
MGYNPSDFRQARIPREGSGHLEIMARTPYITRNSPRLTLQGARLIMAAAARKAASLTVPMDIAVVDDGGHLLVFNRMDGAKLSSIDIAINKAWTAACARRGTHEYADIAGAGKPAFGIHASNEGRFMIFGGGLPIRVDGHVVGGIGCSSGTIQQDREVAVAGINALAWRTGGSRRKRGAAIRGAQAGVRRT